MKQASRFFFTCSLVHYSVLTLTVKQHGIKIKRLKELKAQGID